MRPSAVSSLQSKLMVLSFERREKVIYSNLHTKNTIRTIKECQSTLKGNSRRGGRIPLARQR